MDSPYIPKKFSPGNYSKSTSHQHKIDLTKKNISNIYGLIEAMLNTTTVRTHAGVYFIKHMLVCLVTLGPNVGPRNLNSTF